MPAKDHQCFFNIFPPGPWRRIIFIFIVAMNNEEDLKLA